MCGLIEANLDLCQIPEEQTEVVQAEALDFLKRSVARKFEPWDTVFYDPPYATNYADVLTLIGSHPTDLLQKNGLVIVEHHHKNNLSDSFGSIIRTRILKQGDSALSFYKQLESEA